MEYGRFELRLENVRAVRVTQARAASGASDATAQNNCGSTTEVVVTTWDRNIFSLRNACVFEISRGVWSDFTATLPITVGDSSLHVDFSQIEAIDFAVMSAEFYVKDVEANLDFFEKLGFRRRWAETPDAMGRIPRASLRGGTARIWLRRADEAEGTRPTPGMGLFFWIDGGEQGLTAHRNAIAAQGVAVSPISDDHLLRNFTVTTPDGYSVGFFTQYK